MKELNHLSECEEQVMYIIWECTAAPDLRTVMGMVNIKYGHDWKPQTVSTFMARLRKKGYLSIARKGRFMFYTPLIAKTEYQAFKLSEKSKEFAEIVVLMLQKDSATYASLIENEQWDAVQKRIQEYIASGK